MIYQRPPTGFQRAPFMVITQIVPLYDRFVRGIPHPSRIAVITALLLAVAMPLASQPQRIQLSRDNLHVEIWVDDPGMLDEFGPRFDRLGYIRELRWKDASLLGPWGLPDEFGISGVGVLGYEDAQAGENFVKIGVGSLQRTSPQNYFFSERYPIAERFPITITHRSKHSVKVAQKARPQGISWHYDYEKSYRIENNRLYISYSLTNRSARPFTAEHYNHHWFTLGAGIVGPQHLVETNFPLLLPEGKSPYNVETYRLWPKTQVAPTKSFYYAIPLKNVSPTRNQVRLSAGSIAVTLQGDFSPSQFTVYAQNDTVCPEIFFRGDIAPEKTASWKMSYQFSCVSPPTPPQVTP